jgi:hypothetical protein
MGAGDFMHDPTSLITVVALILARVKILFRNVISWFLLWRVTCGQAYGICSIAVDGNDTAVLYRANHIA